jgi:inositol-hexakisphosphate/diphosphoinositol-pentakisphosphate 1-kinase
VHIATTPHQNSHRNSSKKLSRMPIAKPASLGVVGVCALDIKSESKPSRNILNRLASKGFEVVVFGDKVIFDEGT